MARDLNPTCLCATARQTDTTTRFSSWRHPYIYIIIYIFYISPQLSSSEKVCDVTRDLSLTYLYGIVRQTVQVNLLNCIRP